MTDFIEVRGLTKSFGETQVINGIDLAIRRGSVTVVIGPSGSGKTTLLRSLNALEQPELGFVRIGDFEIDYSQQPNSKALAQLRLHSGMVFQGNNLFGNLTAVQNVALGPVVSQRHSRAVANEEALELLKAVGLSEKAEAYPHQLSGGQQQRVGIARALALKPKVLLFDEPTSALDVELVGEVLSTMRALAKEGWTMVVVTHEIKFAQQVADHVVFIDKGQIVEQGKPKDVLENPEHPRTQEFLRRILGDYEI